MLLVEKVSPSDAADARWTCVDSTHLVQVAQLRNKTIYALKGVRGVAYAAMPAMDKAAKEA
eukprot:3602884-Lingulodinium_polyedra.AAC.1